jgi:hypothetical protein
MYERLTPRLTEPETCWEASTEYVTETPKDSMLALEPPATSEYDNEVPRPTAALRRKGWLIVYERLTPSPTEPEVEAGATAK